MGKYDYEYSKYYNKMRNDVKGIANYNNSKIYRNKKMKRSIIKECLDYSIFQFIVTFVLLVTILAMKYSNDSRSINVFNSFKENVNKRGSFEEIIGNIKEVRIDDINKGVKKCIDWVRINLEESSLE